MPARRPLLCRLSGAAIYGRVLACFLQLNSGECGDFRVKLCELIEMFRGRERELSAQMQTLYQLISLTRDIRHGLGEQRLAFVQIAAWFDYYPDLAKKALGALLGTTSGIRGSWKDMKYFCNYMVRCGAAANHPLILEAFRITRRQLIRDCKMVRNWKQGGRRGRPEISLLAKWFPREGSNRYGWIFSLFAVYTFPKIALSARSPSSRRKAQRMCSSTLRKCLSNLNTLLGTVEINMCAKRWRNIDFDRLSGRTLRKYRHAFAGTSCRLQELPDDRLICALRYRLYLQGDRRHKYVSSRGCAAHELVKDLSRVSSVEDLKLVECQWDEYRTGLTSIKGSYLPIVHMSGCPVQDSKVVGLALALAEIGGGELKGRLVSSKEGVYWRNLSKYPSFAEKVWYLNQHPSNGSGGPGEKAVNAAVVRVLKGATFPRDAVDNVILLSGQRSQSMCRLYEQLVASWGPNRGHTIMWVPRGESILPRGEDQGDLTCLVGHSMGLAQLLDFTALPYSPLGGLRQILRKEPHSGFGNILLDYLSKVK